MWWRRASSVVAALGLAVGPADSRILLTANLSSPLTNNPTWTYSLDTTRTGTFEILHSVQNDADLDDPERPPIREVISRPDLSQPGLLVVSLGDSYISGNGAGKYVESGDGCWRSERAFPHRYAELLSTEGFPTSVVHTACSGNTTLDIDAQIVQAAQVAAGADIVLVTIGANDLNYAGRDGTCLSDLDENGHCPLTPGGHANLRNRIDEVLVRISQGFPEAEQVILVGYPDLDSPLCSDIFGPMFKAFEDLDETQSRAIADISAAPPRAGIDYHFVSLVELYKSRGPCAVWESIEGPDAGRWIRNTEGEALEVGHPTEQGHAATAELLADLQFHRYLKDVGELAPAPVRVLLESSPLGFSTQTIRGSILGDGDSVVAVRVVANDSGSVVLGRGQRWWDGSQWVRSAVSFPAKKTGNRWEFSWNPDDGGTGRYQVVVLAVDDGGNVVSNPISQLVISEDSPPATPTGSAEIVQQDVLFSGSVETPERGTLAPMNDVYIVTRHEETNEYWTGTGWTADVHDPRIAQPADIEVVSTEDPTWTYSLTPGRQGSFNSRVFAATALGVNSLPLDLTFEG